jgi:hypothetical protein
MTAGAGQDELGYGNDRRVGVRNRYRQAYKLKALEIVHVVTYIDHVGRGDSMRAQEVREEGAFVTKTLMIGQLQLRTAGGDNGITFGRKHHHPNAGLS